MVNKQELYKQIGNLRKKYLKSINNITIWHSKVIEALKYAESDDSFINQENYSVVSTNKGVTNVKRNPDDMRTIINRASSFESYYAIFSYIVAIVESFLQEYLNIELHSDKRKVKIRINGINFESKIDVDVILDSEHLENIIDDIINKNIYSVFYASPKLQLDYLHKVSGIEIPEDLFKKWIEIKASRDLIIHNQGIINMIYLSKVDEHLIRGKLDEKIVIVKLYFENSVRAIKSLVGKICSMTQKK